MICPISSLKVFEFSISTKQTFSCSKSTIRTKFEICQQLTIKILEQRKNIVNIDILDTKQLSHIILVLKLLALKS